MINWKILAISITDKGLISVTYRYPRINKTKDNKPIEQCMKDITRQVTEREIK